MEYTIYQLGWQYRKQESRSWPMPQNLV